MSLSQVFIVGQNTNLLVEQVQECLWVFFSRTKESQKLIFKEWLCGIFFSGLKHKKHEPIVQFVLPGFFVDAPRNKAP